jgi:hypothetical protein
MAYISTAEVAAIRTALKDKYGKRLKFSVTKDHHTAVTVSIVSGTVDFSDMWAGLKPEDYSYGYTAVNEYYLENYGRHAKLFADIVKIIKTAPANAPGGRLWFDESDSMTDYFHTAFYLTLQVGKWNKKYTKVTGKK